MWMKCKSYSLSNCINQNFQFSVSQLLCSLSLLLCKKRLFGSGTGSILLLILSILLLCFLFLIGQQSVQNTAARLICGIWHSEHIADALISLCWLRVPGRILFRIAVATCRALGGSAPAYPSSYFTRVTDVPSRPRLRSASSSQLAVPSFNLFTVGKWAFPVSGANFWNSLPSHVTCAPSLAIFCQRLKTFLFHLSYPDLILWLSPTSLWTLR